MDDFFCLDDMALLGEEDDERRGEEIARLSTSLQPLA
jgi:hypothetical protein